MLFEDEQQQQTMKEKEDFLMASFQMRLKCINAVLDGVSEKKIQMFFWKFEWLQPGRWMETLRVSGVFAELQQSGSNEAERGDESAV